MRTSPMDLRTNNEPARLMVGALVSGTVASLVSAAALAVLARAEGKGAVQPVNATSHWLHGKEAARYRGADAGHTLVGFATHFASAVFWALPFEFWRSRRRPSTAGALLAGPRVTSAVAATIAYGVTPKRLTPGWELVLSKHSMVVTYAALALGLASGAKLAQALVGHRD